MKKVMRNKKVIAMMVVGLVSIFLAAGGVVASPPMFGDDPPVESTINYQGQLTDPDTGNPYDGTYDMQFLFYDAATGGSQVGSTITENDVAVTNGLFNVKLDVNQADFNGQGLWLEVMVEGETLSPRQEILPVPYALSLKPGAGISGTVDGQPILHVSNDGSGITAAGLWGTSVNSAGVYGESNNGIGLSGVGHDNSIGTQGWNTGGGVGVSAYSASGAAISASGTGIIESTADSYIWVGGTAFRPYDPTLTFTYWYTGAIEVTSSSVGDKYIKTTITAPSVLYGQDVTVEQLRVNFCCENPASYISDTRLYVQAGVKSGNVIVMDGVDRSSTSEAAYYILDTSGSNQLDADYGVLCLQLKLHFASTTHSIYIGGARLQLSHSST